MVVVEISAGACAFKTVVRVRSVDGYRVAVEIDSDCANVNRLAGELNELDAMVELFAAGEPVVPDLAERILPHRSCPVPIGILKAIEVSAGLALPANVSISFL